MRFWRNLSGFTGAYAQYGLKTYYTRGIVRQFTRTTRMLVLMKPELDAKTMKIPSKIVTIDK